MWRALLSCPCESAHIARNPPQSHLESGIKRVHDRRRLVLRLSPGIRPNGQRGGGNESLPPGARIAASRIQNRWARTEPGSASELPHCSAPCAERSPHNLRHIPGSLAPKLPDRVPTKPPPKGIDGQAERLNRE